LVTLEDLRPQRLALRDAQIDGEALVKLAQSPVVAGLGQLVLEADESVDGDTVIAEFARSMPRHRLERLGLWNIRLTDAGLDALHREGEWPALQHLTLAFNDAPLGSSLLTLFEAACWPQLQRLTLGCCELDPDVLPRVSRLPLAAKLKQLSLWATEGGSAFWRGLPRSSSWSGLRRLNVENSDFDGDAARALSLAEGWSLELIEAYFTELPPSAALALLRAPGLPKPRLRANVGNVGVLDGLALRRFGESTLGGCLTTRSAAPLAAGRQGGGNGRAGATAARAPMAGSEICE
jgi:hypothetical protein